MDGTHQKVSFFYGGDSKGAAELNHGTRSEYKDARYVIAGEIQDLSKEDESRVNVAAVEVIENHSLEVALVSHNPVIEKQQHQLPTSIVWWEQFLPLRSLKVLLVENDDSTRQVVSALLRNCCYEVTAVANVLEAWKILEDTTNHIDLVLTEVVMPCFSGIGLLCKIMSHKTCKTIPVIMMSSNDSMGIVFNCLSKGAVDFLVKPIRKNELRNLWQHVWRRCHSSSGSGSESGIEGQKLTKSKGEDDSDNNIDSNDEDNGSVGLNARDGSDNGSGTQSSWTKCAIEVDSPQSLSLSEQLPGPHKSTCPQIIHPRPETFFSKKMPAFTCLNCNEHDKITGDCIMGKDLKIDGAFMSTDLSDESYQTDNTFTKLTGPSMDKKPENQRKFSDVVQHANCNSLHEPRLQVANQVGGTSDNTDHTFPDTTSRASSKVSKDNDKEYMELPELELSLKRLRSTREVYAPSSDERNVLKRSSLSAFSRYPTSVPSVEVPKGCGGSSLLDNSYVAVPSNQGSNGSSDYIDMGSINKNSATKPEVYKDVSLSTIKCNHHTSAFDSVQPQNSTIQLVVQENIDEVVTAPVIVQSTESKNRVQVQHHHHHYHHHHHHVHTSELQKNQDDSSLESLKTTVANEMSRPIEANADNYSLNGSNSSSNHGSDGKFGHSTSVTMGGPNMLSANTCIAENDRIGGDEGNGCGSGFTRREAALNKFRQKRKERNFSKKVRYQSRKRLAEQRPRFRGQFVRRINHVDHHCADN